MKWTPLHPSSYFNSTDVAELLIRSGADVHARDKVYTLDITLLINLIEYCSLARHHFIMLLTIIALMSLNS